MKKSLIFLLLMVAFVKLAVAEVDFFALPGFSWKSLPLTDAIREVKGNGSRVFAVFTEPECGYCRRYEQTLAQMDNVTIYRFLLPLDPKNMAPSIAIWCSGKDNLSRLSHLKQAMQVRDTDLADIHCKNPLAEIMRFARAQNIYMTPTTISASGRLIQGYVPKANLERWLEGKNAFE